MRKALLLVPVGLAVLVAAAASMLSSLRVAPAAGYWVPPVDMSRVPESDPPAEVDEISEHLAVVNGLKVVHVWGSPREMGRQHGEAVAEDVIGVQETYLQETVIDDWGYTPEYLAECSEAMLPHIPEEYIEEMQGVAEGAGVAYEDVLALHTHADTVHFGKEWGEVKRGGERTPASLCSNFVALGGATVDGKLYHGRNLDWTIKTGVQNHAILLIAEPEGGVPFALLTHAGGIGGVTGMNAEGITFGEMTSNTDDETLDGMPLFLTCRKILDSCISIEEVEEFVTGYPGTTGWNFVCADGEAGDARAFEVDAVHRAVFGINDPAEDHPPLSYPIRDGLRRTNHPTDHAVQASVARRAELGNLTLARAAVPAMDTWQRYEALGQWIGRDHRGEIDERLARGMLQSKPVAAGNTLHSVVFNATDKVLWVANASEEEPAWKQEYVRVALEEWVGQRG